MVKDEFFVLNNGVKIPKVGLGTWQISDEDVTSAVITAINNGYKHIDTAIDYGNEKGVGKGIKKSKINRENLFVTTKIPAHIKTYKQAKQCIVESLERLQLDYVDLMLIHSPRPWEMLWDENAPRYYQENLEVYKAIEEAYKEGKVKSIGLSNFFVEDVRNILENVEIKPVVNQICIYIGNTPLELINCCKSHDMLLQAYSPIATGRLLNNEVVKSMADKYNVSIAQLCIKYCLQIDTLPLPKSSKESHIIDNLKLDFDISQEDMEVLLKQ